MSEPSTRPAAPLGSASRSDDGVHAIRLVVLVVVGLDLVTSVIAQQLGVSGLGPRGPLVVLQSVVTIGGLAAAMWRRGVAAVLLSVVAAVLSLVLGPTGSEVYLVAVTAVVGTAIAARRLVVLLVLAQVAYAVAYHWVPTATDGSWLPSVTVLAVAVVGDAVGLVSRRLLAGRDRRRRQVRQLAAENAEIRAAERRRLADDLQTLVIGDLVAIEAVTGTVSARSSVVDLTRALNRIEALNGALLAKLRALLAVLRSPDPVAVGSPTPPAREWLDRLTGRDVRLAVSVVAGLLLVRAWVTGPVDADLVVQSFALLGIGFVVWRPRVGMVLAGLALLASVVLSAPGRWDVPATALLGLVAAARWGTRRLWAVLVVLLGYAALLVATLPGDPVVPVVLTVVLGVLAVIGGVFVHNLRDAHLRSRLERERLLAVRARSGETERLEVARELHDIVASQLSASSMAVMSSSGSEDRDELAQALARVARAVEAARRELRVLLSAIRDADAAEVSEPAALVTPVGCAVALGRQLRDDGFHPVVQADPEADRLDLATQRTINRILQEATTNVLRYAPAGSAVELTLSVDAHAASVVVSSDLRPAARSDLSLGWGLRGIRERMDLIGGTFSAGPQGGRWVVSATVPDLVTAAVG